MGKGSAKQRKGCSGVCSGKADCWANLLCAPCVLPSRSCLVYALPCVEVYFNRCLSGLLQKLCCCCGTYTDRSFPASDASIGSLESKPSGGSPQWLRGAAAVPALVASSGDGATQWAKPRAAVLVRNGIMPSDIAQGALGDCWLLSAFACLAEFPGTIENLFLTREVSPRGKYSVRLYDDRQEDWKVITVDDSFPCDAEGKPLFAQPSEGELWVLVLEKAFAKLCGSYAALEGGLTLWALHVMTGDHVFSLSRKEGAAWKRLDMRPQPTDDNPRKVGLYYTKEEYTAEQLWELLKSYDSSAALLAASISSQAGEAKRDDGLVAGHAYSIIRVAEMQGFRLVQLRNPWGRYEWGGEWSDESPLWDEHPAVQRALWPLRSSTPRNRMNDGTFWMPFATFCEIYSDVDVCDRSTGLHDLSLRFDEDGGACAPFLGCLGGCASFWCACHGCTALYCGHTSNTKTRELKKGCCSCWCCC